MTATPPQVGDVFVDRLRASPGAAAPVEPTTMISAENMRSRTDTAPGPTVQGFEDHGDGPSPAGDRTAGRRWARSAVYRFDRGATISQY